MPGLSLGEWVIIKSQRGKSWLVRIEEAPFSSHVGTVQMGDAVGKKEGDFLETQKGVKLFLFRPTLADYIYKMNRQTQIIYPKDLGAIVVYGDIRPGSRVLESGIGSGALTLALLRAVGQRGRVISVEKRVNFAMLARENICRFFGSPLPNHDIIVSDIQDLALRLQVDRIVLDLPEPWHAVSRLAPLLGTGGILVSLSPNVAQVQLTFRELKFNGFTNIATFELLQREWMVDERRSRPVDRMIAHTGFITVARKWQPPLPPTPSEEFPE